MNNPVVTYALILVQPVPHHVNDRPLAHIVKIAEGKQERRVTVHGQQLAHDPGIDRLVHVTSELYAPCPVSCIMKQVHLN